jgi:hypothetical protein
LDAAVIAAVNNNALNVREKESYAKTHFRENYTGKLKIELGPVATSGRMEMSAKGRAPVTVSALLGFDGIDIFDSSSAEIASENVICVMSLAQTGKERITFKEDVTFIAQSCSVYANSTDPRAISSRGSKIPIAKSFCTAGGVTGDFIPYAKGQCKPAEDPYKHVRPAPSGPCVAGTFPKPSVNITDPNESGNMTGSYVTLFPGTYCGGLTVDGRNVKFT